MSRRFFAKHPVVGETIVISDEQAHHIANVMRFKSGERVTLFDGSGKEYSAVLEDVARKTVTLHVFSESHPIRQISRHLTLAVALPKGDRQKFLVEKLVELGVSSLVPIRTGRSVSIANEKAIGRIRKQIIEACKQCGRNTLMDVAPECSLQQLISIVEKDSGNPVNDRPICAIASPSANRSVVRFNNENSHRIVVAVGPEGGFEQHELELAIDSGWQAISLGTSILRIETAAIALAAILGIGRPEPE